MYDSLYVSNCLYSRKRTDFRTISSKMLNYFEDQFRFYENLPDKIQQKTMIRMYKGGSDYGWNVRQRWIERFPNVWLREPDRPLSYDAQNCRLLIGTYNATTYNESLAANIPTVIYWDTRYWEWAAFADADFANLKSVRIFHDSPESAAAHVSEIWDSVSTWWYSRRVQTARADFCRKYAHRDNEIERRLAGVLREASRAHELNSAKIDGGRSLW